MSETPAGLDQSFPGDVVDRTGDRESPRALKRLDESDGAITECLLSVASRDVSERSQAFV